MKFGLSLEQYDYLLKEIVSPIKALGGEVFCFGSRARGDHHSFSDIDLMIESDLDLSKIIADISEKIEEGGFPYKVDIVQYKKFATGYKKDYEKDKKVF